jgi:hypothetical protein
MFRLFQRKILALFCLLIYLASGYGSAYAAVWCFGSDGHIEFKVAPKPGCTPAAQTENQATAVCGSALVKSECCGPCLDIPTSYTALQVTGKRLEAKKAPADIPAALFLSSRPPVTVALAVPNRLPRPPPSANSPLSHLKTVVLLN